MQISHKGQLQSINCTVKLLLERNALKCIENTNSSVEDRTCLSVGVSATQGNVANFRNFAAIVTTAH